MMRMIFKKNENVVTRVVAGEAILVPISGNIANMQHIFSLNEVGECIWENIDGERDLSQVADLIVKEFEIEVDVAQKDCLEFVQSLYQSQLVAAIV